MGKFIFIAILVLIGVVFANSIRGVLTFLPSY